MTTFEEMSKVQSRDEFLIRNINVSRKLFEIPLDRGSQPFAEADSPIVVRLSFGRFFLLLLAPRSFGAECLQEIS